MTKIPFKHQGRHTTTNGEAIIANSHSHGSDMAKSNFLNNGDVRNVKIELLTIEKNHKIYECYTDSGSIDYFYFAIQR